MTTSERGAMRSTILFVPGLRDHVADHWQTLLAAELPGSRTVAPLEHDKLSCAARVEGAGPRHRRRSKGR